MINYYYEMEESGTFLGLGPGKFFVLPDYHPKHHNKEGLVHSVAYATAVRVWLENDNGVTLVKALKDDNSWGRVNSKEFFMVKLRAIKIG